MTKTSSFQPRPAVPSDRRQVVLVFIGLMLGMLLASANMTMVAPALPRIVAELGGLESYSWIAVSAMLASTVIVPIVGKLSDLWGRKSFYMGGVVLFTLGSLLSGLAQDVTALIVSRAVQGLGMGTLMPLSQAIIGDLIAPRERGKYQGLLGAVFGLSSVVGPLVGGYLTDNLSWRWLFFVNLPLGLLTLGFIIPFMRLPHVKRSHALDVWGMITLTVGLTTTLLATAWGGTQYPWGSAQILGLYALGVLFLGTFILVELRAEEPVLPLRLWRNSIFTLANVSSMTVAMSMFALIFFVPVFVQGVLGSNATESGAILIPMILAMVATSVANGFLISRTGRYKPSVVLGILVMGVGYYLLTLMDRATTSAEVVRNLLLIGLGLGAVMQTFVLIVQNAVSREDLGVATGTSQLTRSMGSTVGIAIMGTVMSQGMARELPEHLPPRAAAIAQGGRFSVGELLDPAGLASLPPDVLEGLRAGLAEALHSTFVAGLPFIAIALVAALFLKEIPLRQASNVRADQGSVGEEQSVAHTPAHS